jgi:hypothetical protein
MAVRPPKLAGLREWSVNGREAIVNGAEETLSAIATRNLDCDSLLAN